MISRTGIKIFFFLGTLAVWTVGCYPWADAGEPECSPYVAERLKEPINWHPWNEQTRLAFKASGKPGLISVSHELNALSMAMGKETFRNPDIARQVNEHFFSVVIDKNEFPILADYLTAYVWQSKQVRGWPLTVLVTPDLLPINGGGYFPPTDSWGSQGFSSVINSVSEQWGKQNGVVGIKAQEALGELDLLHGLPSKPSEAYDESLLSVVVENVARQWDETHGGFSLPPKTAPFAMLGLLDRVMEAAVPEQEVAQKMRDITLASFMRSAVRDYVHGGFFAGASDEAWSIPDFRKRAVIQAQAIHFLSRYPKWHDVVKDTANALVNDFRANDGLYSEHVTRVAGSSENGAETGSAYTWSYEELSSLLTVDELAACIKLFGIKPEGNVSEDWDVGGVYKGRNILRIAAGSAQGETNPVIGSIMKKLKAASKARSVLKQELVSSVATNALVASALVKAGDGYYGEATSLAGLMVRTFWDKDSKILRAVTQSGGVKEPEASSKGYALFIKALLDVETVTGDPAFLKLAVELQSIFDEGFGSRLGPYMIAPVQDPGIPLNVYSFIEDDAGSANAIALGNLLRLAKRYPDESFGKRAEAILNHMPDEVSYAPEQYPALISNAVGR